MTPGRGSFPPACPWRRFLGACGEEDFLSPLLPAGSAGAALAMGPGELAVAGAGPGRTLLWGDGTRGPGVQRCRAMVCVSPLGGLRRG